MRGRDSVHAPEHLRWWPPVQGPGLGQSHGEAGGSMTTGLPPVTSGPSVPPQSPHGPLLVGAQHAGAQGREGTRRTSQVEGRVSPSLPITLHCRGTLVPQKHRELRVFPAGSPEGGVPIRQQVLALMPVAAQARPI